MSLLPAAYRWLDTEPAPRILREALALFGVVETPGDADNPKIMGWAKEVGVQTVYSGDEIPWCGLFMAVCAKRAGKPIPKDPLWALNWVYYGQPSTPIAPMLGDVLIFRRKAGGHVGLYVGEDAEAYHVLGGNQSDQVCITRIQKTRLYAARRTAWTTAQPGNIRRVYLAATGEVSRNEA